MYHLPTTSARQSALTNIYGNTPFDTPPNAPTTWNFPKTDVNSTAADKGWPGFNDIKQKNNKLFQINFESYFNIKKLIFESIVEQHKLEEDIKDIIDKNSLNFY